MLDGAARFRFAAQLGAGSQVPLVGFELGHHRAAPSCVLRLKAKSVPQAAEHRTRCEVDISSFYLVIIGGVRCLEDDGAVGSDDDAGEEHQGERQWLGDERDDERIFRRDWVQTSEYDRQTTGDVAA